MQVFHLPFWTFVGVIAGIYTILSLGLFVQYAMAGLPNFGHVAFMALAAYTMAILVVQLSAPMWGRAACGMLMAVVFSLLLGVPSLRLRADYLAIVTVAGGEIIRFLALNMIDLTGGAVGSIGMLGQGNLAQYNTAWEEMLTRFTAILTPVLGAAATRDMAMLMIVWTLALILLALFWGLIR